MLNSQAAAKRHADELADELGKDGGKVRHVSTRPARPAPETQRTYPKRDPEAASTNTDTQTADGWTVHVRENYHGAWARISHRTDKACGHGLCKVPEGNSP